MKKLAFIFGALLMGFVMVSCGDSTKDNMIKDVDAYFSQAEQELNAIDNTEDFLAFVEGMNDRSDLLEILDQKYGDKTVSDDDQKALEDFIYSRATAYNQAESVKCSEFLVPAIDRLEVIVNKMYPLFQAGEAFDEESIDEFLDAFTSVTAFSVCENVNQELSDRLSPIFDKEEEMSETILARLEEIYPETEE